KLFQQLAAAYKQINAPVGQFGLDTLAISNIAITSGDSMDDSTYTQLEGNLQNFNAQRNDIASQMVSILEGTAFKGQTIDPTTANDLIQQANQLLQDVQ